MYQLQSSNALLRAHRRLLGARRGELGVGRTVVLLGLTSLFTDISSEMVAAVLPLYLVYTVGLSPLGFGVADGLYQGAAALVQMGSGFIGDRWRRHKEVASVGYGLSAICKLGFLAAGSALGAISSVIILDRTGKGIRTGPRDAMISLSTPPESLGTAFGVHRALDTTGAMIGPLAGFGLLLLSPDAFNAIFVLSFLIALIGLGILILLVRAPAIPRPRAAVEKAAEPRVSMRAALGLLAGKRYRVLVLVGAGLGLATMSDAFVYLALQRHLDFYARYLPLLYVGTAVVYMLLAVPFGRLADRFGRGRVLICGYILLLGVYAILLLPSIGGWALVLCLTLLGSYYAATDGVLMALGSAVLPPELRGSGLSLLASGTAVSRLLASLIFGALWTWLDLRVAVTCFAVALIAMTVAAAAGLRRSRLAAADG